MNIIEKWQKRDESDNMRKNSNINILFLGSQSF